MTVLRKIIKISALVGVFMLIPALSHAATFNTTIDKEGLTVGTEFNAIIAIDSEDVGINAAQATLKYNNDILEVKKVDKTDSIFTFWLVDPGFDNSKGEVSFVGGSTSGFTGKSLQIIKINFKVKGTGTGNLVFTDSAITASDGSGTNVLTASKGLEIVILSKSETISVKPPQISREPEVAKNAPAKPKVTIPLYPDPASWYNLSSDFGATWNLPPDVTDVATSLNKIPDSAPAESEGLFDNKVFKALSNGIYYLHVRFRNNVGWGATNHYRIAIDTVPPLPFKVDISTGLSSDNPAPAINYVSKDQFSGIDYYSIKIGNLPENKISETSYTPSPLPPGEYAVVVTARDKAGNAAEARVSIEVLPIPSPEILSIRKDIYVGEGGLSVTGSSLPLISVVINLRDLKDNLVYNTETLADENGFWSASIDSPLKKGVYVLEAVNKDSRGALSLPVKSDEINVRERPILTIGGIGITYSWFLLGLIIIFGGAFLGGWYVRRTAASQRERRILIAERDVNSALVNIKADVEKMIREHKGNGQLEESIETKVNFLLKKINDSITKNKSYILENIEEID